MTRLSFSVFFILLLISPLVSAQQTLQDLTLSSVITKGRFPVPIVVTNDFRNEWLVTWDQPGTVKGRIVKPDGQLSSIKTLVKGKVVDVIYDPIHDTYLILYFHGQSYLRAQLLSGNLKKKGDSHLVQVPSASYYTYGSTQLIFDPVAGRFLVFWIESTGPDPAGHYLTAIKSQSLDATGKAISEAVTVLDGGSDVYYRHLRVVRNPENGNLFLRVYQDLSKGGASVLGYTLKSDGTLLRTRPVRFAAMRSVFSRYGFSIPDAEFADNGTGIATWEVEDLDGIFPTKIKIRQLTSKGTFNSKSKLIAEDDFVYSEPRIVFDRSQNAFLVLWDAGSIAGMLLDANTVAVLKGPFTIATNPINGGSERGLTGAYESSSGRILIVWTSVCDNPFFPSCPGNIHASAQVMGAIFSSK